MKEITIYINEYCGKYWFSVLPNYWTICECVITDDLFKELIWTTLERVDLILRDMYKKEIIERMAWQKHDRISVLFDTVENKNKIDD